MIQTQPTLGRLAAGGLVGTRRICLHRASFRVRQMDCLGKVRGLPRCNDGSIHVGTSLGEGRTTVRRAAHSGRLSGKACQVPYFIISK
jgi:hypothetical protein